MGGPGLTAVLGVRGGSAVKSGSQTPQSWKAVRRGGARLTAVLAVTSGSAVKSGAQTPRSWRERRTLGAGRH